MKKILLSTTFLIAGAFSILAQGLVDFSNAPWEAWPEASPPNRLIYLGDTVATGTLISDPAYTAGLFENRGGNWVQLGDRLPFFGTGLEGIIAGDGVPRVLSVPKLTKTELQIKVFDPTGLEMIYKDGSTISDGAGGFNTALNIFKFTQGDSVPPSPTDTLFVNMRAFSVVPVPEPSTVALGVLGLGALLLFRRRK